MFEVTVPLTEREIKFKERLIAWLARFGLTKEQCDEICADRKIAYYIFIREAGSIVDDLPSVLDKFGEEGKAANKVLESWQGGLGLTMSLMR